MQSRKHSQWQNEFEDAAPSRRRLAGITYRVEALRMKQQLRRYATR